MGVPNISSGGTSKPSQRSRSAEICTIWSESRPALTLCLAEGPGAPLLLRCGTSVLHRRSVYGAWARQQRALQLREDRGGAVSEALPMAGEDADEALARWTAALEDVDLALAAADPARAALELELALASAGPGSVSPAIPGRAG